jgi:hypothetical protein
MRAGRRWSGSRPSYCGQQTPEQLRAHLRAAPAGLTGPAGATCATVTKQLVATLVSLRAWQSPRTVVVQQEAPRRSSRRRRQASPWATDIYQRAHDRTTRHPQAVHIARAWCRLVRRC